MWQVNVSNLGTVHSDDTERGARIAFNDYVKACKAPYGRASGESVYLFDDSGELVKEYTGKLHRHGDE